MTPRDGLECARNGARKSPCAKSKRGVSVWHPDEGLLAVGWNEPAAGECDGSEACRASCSRICVHAEADAIIEATSWRARSGHRARDLSGCHLLHVKVVDGEPVASGPPSCWQCSRLILRAGIETVWLVHAGADGLELRSYTAAEFHDRTLQHCGLHPHGAT